MNEGLPSHMHPPGQSINITHFPNELLTEIFRLATDNPVRDLDALVSWTPFEGSYASLTREACKSALQTKLALTFVSSAFRTLMLEFLYEDIWIRHGSETLLEVLESSKQGDASASSEALGYGRFVKRISLSVVGYTALGRPYTSIPQSTRRILSCCPYVHIISRVPHENLEGPVGSVVVVDAVPALDDLDLPFLRRVEWHNTPNDTIAANAPIPSLFLFHRFLHVLILGPDNFPSRRSANGEEEGTPETILSLPNLHTLAIQSLDAFGEPPRRYTLHLPSLRKLILKRPEAIYNIFDGALTPLASQLTSLELASDFRFLRQDFLSTLLTHCTGVSDLYIPVFATRAVHPNEIPRVFLEFPSVRCVHLNARLPNGYVYGAQAWWTMLDAHFEGLCSRTSRFVGLERVVLNGPEWIESVSDTARFAGCALRLARMKGVELVADDVDAGNALARVRAVREEE